jgi:hypothetical protein
MVSHNDDIVDKFKLQERGRYRVQLIEFNDTTHKSLAAGGCSRAPKAPRFFLRAVREPQRQERKTFAKSRNRRQWPG